MRNYNKVIPIQKSIKYYNFVKSLAKIILKTFFRIGVEGNENVKLDESFLILSNHNSYLDPIIIGCTIDRLLAYMAKEELFKVPILNEIMYHVGAFAVKRGKGDKSYLENSINALKNDWLLNMFPEGSRSITGKFEKIKYGAAKILLNHPIPFLPIALINTNIAMGKHKPIKLFTKITVRIGKLVYPEEYMPNENLTEEEKLQHIGKIYYSKIYDLLPQDQKSLEPIIKNT